MVFVTVGNAEQGFGRLLGAVDELAGRGAFDGEPVLLQSGQTKDFRAASCEQVPFLPMDVFMERLLAATVLISHAGAGTLLHAWEAGKVPVVMPRQHQYGEHIDDHQVELTRALAGEGYIVPAYEPVDLPDAIGEVRRLAATPRASASAPLIELVRREIDRLGARQKGRRYPLDHLR